MLGRVVVSLHDLQSSSRPDIFGEAFMEGLTMIPRAFFYSSPSPLTTKLPKFHLKTASGEPVAVGWDPPSEAESEGSRDSRNTSGRTPPGVPMDVNSGSHSQEPVQQPTPPGDGTEDNRPDPQDPPEGSRDDEVAMSGEDKEEEGDGEGSGEKSAGSGGDDEDDEGEEPEGTEDDTREEDSRVHSETTETDDNTPGPMARTPPTAAAVADPVARVAPEQRGGGSETMVEGEGAPEDPVLGHPAAFYQPVVGRDGPQVQSAHGEDLGVHSRRGTAESPQQQSAQIVPPTQRCSVFPVPVMRSRGLRGQSFSKCKFPSPLRDGGR